MKNTKHIQMARLLTVMGLVSWITFGIGEVRAGTPIRDGFTLELGIGGAFTHANYDLGEDMNEFSHSMLTLSLGAFLTEDLAIMAHMAGTTMYKTFDDDDVVFTNQFLGVVAQYWFTDTLYTSGGIGVALFGVLFEDSYEQSTDYGMALSFRVGYSFLTFQNHSLRLAVEVIPTFFDSRVLVGTALNLEWQYF